MTQDEEYRATIDEEVHPTLITGVGDVSGVHFPPDPHGVVVHIDGRHIRAHAGADLVACALAMRGQKVRVMILLDRRESRPVHRLIWIRPEDEPLPIPTAEERLKMILERWPETLKELAQ